jgi:hypothetical protein
VPEAASVEGCALCEGWLIDGIALVIRCRRGWSGERSCEVGEKRRYRK